MSSMMTIYTMDEAAKLLGVSRRTIFEYINKGKLKATRPGRRWIITQESLDLFVNTPDDSTTMISQAEAQDMYDRLLGFCKRLGKAVGKTDEEGQQLSRTSEQLLSACTAIKNAIPLLPEKVV